MDRCSACGTACSASAKFCTGCGIRLSNRASTPHTATAVSVPYGVNLAGGGAAVLPPGTLLQGRYRIERVLGTGAFGRVYLAQDLQDAAQPSVAIKELLDAQFSTPEEKHEAVLWFKREASTLLTLEHPGIPAIYTYWTAQRAAGPFYLAMEYVPGQTLEGVLQNAGGRVAWQKVVAWGIALCDVLSYLHSRTPPVVFRDLKLPNIMLNSATNALVLIDFGIARQLAPSGTAIGTWGYVPMEQVLGHADPRSDIYALGATLHALVTGRRPDAEYTQLLHSGLDVEGAMRALFPAAHTLVPAVPAWLGQVLTKATAFAVADRYDDAASMAAALRHASRQNRGAAPRVVPAPPARPQPSVAPLTTVGAASSSVPGGAGSTSKPRKGRKRRALAWSGLALTVSCLAIAGIVASNSHVPSQPDAGGASGSTQTLVHVCTAAHYEKGAHVCTQDDSTIGNLVSGHVLVHAAGQQFSTDRLIVNVVRWNSDGSSSPLGATTWTGERGSRATAKFLYDDVFHDAGVAPQAETTYQLTVRSGRQRLGSAMFTYQPGPTPAFSTQTLVHVCTAAHYDYDKDDRVCTQDDSTISNLAAAHLIVYSAGRTFSTDSLIVNVARRNSDGSSSPLGSATETGNRGYGSDSEILYDSVFHDADVAPQAETTYQLTVRSGGHSLGSAMFTYQPGPAPAFSTQTLVHVCTAAHHDKDDQVCTQDDRTIANLAAAHLIVYSAGPTFSADSLIVNVARRNSDGSSSPLGSATGTGNRDYGGVDWFLYDDVFHDAGVTPQAGTTYQLTVRSDRRSLGSAMFTYQPGPAPAFSTQTLVHVCTAAHYEKDHGICTQDDSTIGNLGAHLIIYAAGQQFSTDSLIVNVAQRNSDGSFSPLGSTTGTGNRGNWAADWILYDDVFHDAGVAPQAGITYQITVGSGRQSLGSATFTYQPGAR
jgi:serine/threonine protein kinase